MPSSDYDESIVLAEWAEEECRHLDVVASWETLLSVYEALGFDGPIPDETRIEEFKTIITEVNKFLTRMKNGLHRTRDIEDAIEFLRNHANVKDATTLKSRPAVAYNKLKQSWIRQSIGTLLSRAPEMEDEGERDE